MRLNIEQSINRGINFLKSSQLDDGRFRCYISNNDLMLNFDQLKLWRKEEDILFTNLLIGSSLLFLRERTSVNTMLERVADFVLHQRIDGKAWKHYLPGHPLYDVSACDVDDTACAESFLEAMNISFKHSRSLIKRNIDKRGLFYTWFALRYDISFHPSYLKLAFKEFLRPVQTVKFWKQYPCERDDIDGVVNANALYYLGEIPETEPVITYLISLIKENREADCDKWYRTVYTAYYFISRNYYKGIKRLAEIRTFIITRILSHIKAEGCIGNNVVDTAMCLSTLFNLNYVEQDLTASIAYIIANQSASGSWASTRVYYGDKMKSVGWGSEELSTSLCLEALERYCSRTR